MLTFFVKLATLNSYSLRTSSFPWSFAPEDVSPVIPSAAAIPSPLVLEAVDENEARSYVSPDPSA